MTDSLNEEMVDGRLLEEVLGEVWLEVPPGLFLAERENGQDELGRVMRCAWL